MGTDMPHVGTFAKPKICPTGPLFSGALAGHNGVMLNNNIAALRKSKNLSQTELADRIGTTLNMMGKLERGSRDLNSSWITKISEALGVAPDAILAAPGTMPVRVSDQPIARNASQGETAAITALDLSLSMGPGTPIEDFVESEPVELDIGLLRSITRTPFHKLRIVRGIGSSMEPKFYTGDRILVDTSDRSLSRMDGYYWITLWGSHGLKKLRPAGKNRVKVISENPDDEPIEVDAGDLTIEGRAIWFARDL